jgi:valyl-tRNA synthetase
VFPRSDQSWVDAAAEAEMQLVQDVAVACRMLRATYGVSPAQTIAVELRAADAPREILERHKSMVERSAKITATIAGIGGGPLPNAAKAVVGADVQALMPLGGLVDAPKERARIAKDIDKSKKELAALDKKLGNADFIARAPEEVVAEIRTRLQDEQRRLAALAEAADLLGAVS